MTMPMEGPCWRAIYMKRDIEKLAEFLNPMIYRALSAIWDL